MRVSLVHRVITCEVSASIHLVLRVRRAAPAPEARTPPKIQEHPRFGSPVGNSRCLAATQHVRILRQPNVSSPGPRYAPTSTPPTNNNWTTTVTTATTKNSAQSPLISNL
ncbi:hypothetical protein CGRA01v4_02965 [Colletotrichum graminicola]|nr:hypothetical protein CGRA01v4_02965 [Colletotrichum graminicola]